MAKGRKRTSDQSKRLRGTDQPCRMDGAVAPALTPSDLKVSSHIPHSPTGFRRFAPTSLPACGGLCNKPSKNCVKLA